MNAGQQLKIENAIKDAKRRNDIGRTSFQLNSTQPSSANQDIKKGTKFSHYINNVAKHSQFPSSEILMLTVFRICSWCFCSTIYRISPPGSHKQKFVALQDIQFDKLLKFIITKVLLLLLFLLFLL